MMENIPATLAHRYFVPLVRNYCFWEIICNLVTLLVISKDVTVLT